MTEPVTVASVHFDHLLGIMPSNVDVHDHPAGKRLRLAVQFEVREGAGKEAVDIGFEASVAGESRSEHLVWRDRPMRSDDEAGIMVLDLGPLAAGRHEVAFKVTAKSQSGEWGGRGRATERELDGSFAVVAE